MPLALRVIAILSFGVAVVWWLVSPGFDALLAFLAGVTTLLVSFAIDKARDPKAAETLDERNRRVMLDHVENFWVKGILEKSLHGAALLELGIKEDPGALRYPWTIKKEATDEPLPAGKSMLEIFREIGAGRSLLVLGAPGAGKTSMLLELARGLIERARQEASEPVPVVFNLASWTEKQALTDWLAEQLNLVYSVPKKIAPSWVEGNKMFLLLDGLDEVREDRRLKCVEAINGFRTEHGLTSLAVCCRVKEYEGIAAKLAFEGAITLQPLTSEQVDTYFDRFGESLSALRLLLQKDRALRELSETPLTLSIMALAYKDRMADDLPGSGTLEAQRRHLFDTYIDRMFEHSTRSANAPFTKPETLHYLGWLARTMIRHDAIPYQIESMQPSWLETEPDIRLYRLYAGPIVWLLVGLFAGLLVGLVGGLVAGLIVGLGVGLGVGLIGRLIGGRNNSIVMADRLKWSWKEARRGLIIGLIGGLSFGLIFGLNERPNDGLLGVLISGLSGGLIIGPIAWLSFGLSSDQVEETTYPGQRLKQTFLTGLFSALIFGLIGGLIEWLISGLSDAPIGGLTGGLMGALFFGYGSLVQHYALRLLLARQRFLPRRLIPFLEYCVSLIFLRRVGGSYVFVHRLLMEHLAEVETPEGGLPEAPQETSAQGSLPAGGEPPVR